MIFYLSRAAHQYTLRGTLDVAMVEGAPPLASLRQYRLLSYERLFKLRKLPVGSYIFSDLERLDSAATECAALARKALSESGRGLVLLNDPLRSMRRFELLRHLHHNGTNAFNVRRLTDADLPSRLPVFIRDEHEHRGSLTPLLHTKQEFEAAVEGLLAKGMTREDKLVVEFLDTADAQGLHHRYSALRIGSHILPVCLFFSRKWIIKNRDQTLGDPELLARERDYLATNPHEAALRPIFDLARIEFGRIDYAMVDGRPQIFEINTNPSWVRGEDLLAALPEIECRAENDTPIPIVFERQEAWREQRDLYYWYHRLLHRLRVLRSHMGYPAKNPYPDSRVQVSYSELTGSRAGDLTIGMVSAERTLHWQGSAPGRVRLGSDAHKSLFTTMLRDTFNPYDPAQIEWPQLSTVEHKRLASLPFWSIAVETEAAAGARVCAYAEEVPDPEVRRAIELAGFEELRHSQLFIHMAAAYSIPVTQTSKPVPPRDREWAFMLWGIAEGLDSFFAFGLYEAASRSQFLPPRLIQVFGPVVQEEARHVVFFRNWIAWRKRALPWWQRPIFVARLVSVWLFIVWKRLQTVQNLSGSQSLTMTGFTETGEQSLGIGLCAAELLDLCFAESDRRLNGYDRRLLRPIGVPRLLRFARLFMRRPRRATSAFGA